MTRTVSTHTDERNVRLFASDEAISEEISKSLDTFAEANPELYGMLRDAVDLTMHLNVGTLAQFLVSGDDAQSRSLANLVVNTWLQDAAKKCKDAAALFECDVASTGNHADYTPPSTVSLGQELYSALNNAKSVYFDVLQTVVAARKADEGRATK